MLQRRVSGDGVVWYESPRLTRTGTRHAFSTRLGGVSSGIFGSLNLGNPSPPTEQDARENIDGNYRRLMAAAGHDVGRQELCRVHQVHGAVVVAVRAGSAHDPHAKADALVTDDPGRVVSVRVADCVPVLLASAGGEVVSAVHAGWRGVVSQVTGAAIAEMRRIAPTAPIVAAIGPSIGFDAFEVGPEVVREFEAAFERPEPELPFVRTGAPGKWHVDLKAAISEQLRRLGVTEIDVSDRCTVRDVKEFFSHRRDQGVTGRMAALIAPKSKVG